MNPILPDMFVPNLKIVFCGTAAGNESARQGAYYAHHGNKFWLTLHSWSADRTLRLWDADGGHRATLAGHTGRVNGALALADGRFLSWSADGALRLWDASGASLDVLESEREDRASIVPRAWAHGFDPALFFPRDRVLGTAKAYYSGNAVRLYDPRSGQTLSRFTGDDPFTCLALLMDGKTLAAGDQRGRVIFLRMAE